MNRQSLVVGGIVVVAMALVYIQSQSRDNTPELEEFPVSSEETENMLEEVLGRTIPDDAEKVSLRDLTNSGMSAIATRAENAGVVEFTVLADLEEVEGDYQVWTGNNASNLKQLGVLSPAKGGYLFEYRKAGSLEEYNNVEVKLGEKKVLEGSF